MAVILLGLLIAAQAALALPLAWNGSLSKAQAVARVMTAGFDVRMAQADAEMAAAGVPAQRSSLLPQVSVAGNAIDSNLAQLGMPIARQTYVGVSGNIPLLQIAGVSALHAAKDEATASAADLNAAKNDAALGALQAYDNALLASEVAISRKVAVVDQEANVRFTQLRVQTGKLPRYELARAGAALADARQLAEDAAAQRDEAMNDLKLALDLDLKSNVLLTDSLEPLPFIDTPEAAAGRALAHRPDLAAAAARVREAQAKVSQATSAFVPTISVIGQTYNGRSTPPLGAAGSQVGVTVSVPLIDSGSRPAAVHQAQADLEKAQVGYERRRLMVEDDVANTWRGFEAARKNLDDAQAVRVDAEENLRIARLRRSAGKGIELEVLDALSVAASSREMVLRAQARYDLAVGGVHHAAADFLSAR